MTWGISKSLASNGAVLNLMIPVITAVLASFMLREKLTLLRIVSLAIGLVGVLLMSVQDLRESSFLDMKYIAGQRPHPGRLLRLVLLQHLLQGTDAAFSGNRDSDFQLYHGFGGQHAAADLGGAFPLERIRHSRLEVMGRVRVPGDLHVRRVHAASSLPRLEHLDVTVASVSLYLVPIFGVLLAAVLLGERLARWPWRAPQSYW